MALRSSVHIGKVVHDAAVFNFSKWQGTSMNSAPLPEIVACFFDLLEERQIEYVLVGGIAMLQYVEGRNTEDIDLIVAVSSLDKLPEVQIESREPYFARGHFRELSVDFLLTENPLFKEVHSKYTEKHSFVEKDIQCATVEGLMLLKLYALPSLYREGEFARVGMYENDIATLMHYHQPDLNSLLNILSDHLIETDITSLRQIVSEIEQRLERFRKGFGEG